MPRNDLRRSAERRSAHLSHSHGPAGQALAVADPVLARVVEAWPDLSSLHRTAIVAIVNAGCATAAAVDVHR
jgi:hypothetical protein